MASYIGSKRRISKEICDVMENIVKEKIPFYDLFCGGLSVSLEMCGRDYEVHANDIQKDLIFLWEYMKNNEIEYNDISKEEFIALKNQSHQSYEKSFWMFYGTFNNIPYGNMCKPRTNGRSDTRSRFNTLLKLQERIRRIENFTSEDYREFRDLKGCIIYLDPPYKGVVNKYTKSFDHEALYEFIEHVSKHNHVFLSELTPPPNRHVVVYEKQITNKWNDTMMTEKLFYMGPCEM